jgi:TIR domain
MRHFVSYAHRDRSQVQQLLELLTPRFKIAAGIALQPWSDDLIPVGAQWRQEIEQAIQACDFGLLMLSPEFFASDFITRAELPHFIAPQGAGAMLYKPIVPVGLKPVPLDGSADLKGVQHTQIFRDDAGRCFSQTRGHLRDAFADRLTAAILAKFRRAAP